jgi:hypothetical protein
VIAQYNELNQELPALLQAYQKTEQFLNYSPNIEERAAKYNDYFDTENNLLPEFEALIRESVNDAV